MSFLQTNGINLHYCIDGPDDAPTVLLSNSIGTDLSTWDGVVDQLKLKYRVIRYDSRGHGKTDAPSGPYTIAMLSTDVLGILDQLGLEKVHFCGLSLGGMVGMWLATNASNRIDKLILCNTAAFVPPPEGWDARADAVRDGGMQAIIPAVLERWLSQDFQEREPEAVKRLVQMVQASPAAGYIGSCAAIRDMDQRMTIQSITASTLVIAGAKDIATTPDGLRFIAARLVNKASYAEIDCGHMSCLENPAQLGEEIKKFL